MGPVVTVVIPAYNRAGTIAAALESVQAQTYRNWEAIVINDGSSDGTADVVRQLISQDRRIRLLEHEANRGAQAARNWGIRAACGEWIAFLDSDDVFLRESIELRLRVAAKEGVSVVHSRCLEIREDGSQHVRDTPPVQGSVYRRLLRGEGPTFPGLLVATSALQRIGYLDERIVSFQEWDTSIRLAKHYAFGFVPEPTFIYDWHAAVNISHQVHTVCRGYKQVVRKHIVAIIVLGGPNVLAPHCRRIARLSVAAGKEGQARYYDLMGLLVTCLDPRWCVRSLRRAINLGE